MPDVVDSTTCDFYADVVVPVGVAANLLSEISGVVKIAPSVAKL